MWEQGDDQLPQVRAVKSTQFTGMSQLDVPAIYTPSHIAVRLWKHSTDGSACIGI